MFLGLAMYAKKKKKEQHRNKTNNRSVLWKSYGICHCLGKLSQHFDWLIKLCLRTKTQNPWYFPLALLL